MLLHLSVPADDPETVAHALARILGGEALPFPPFPGCWIAFSAADDGSAVEVWPRGHRIVKGAGAIGATRGNPPRGAGAVHVALASPLAAGEVLALGAEQGWTARICDRGPFECVELWVEEDLLVEVLDPGMADDYRRGMTAANWRAMFGL